MTNTVPFMPPPMTDGNHKLPIGVSLKSQHYQDVLDLKPAVTFFEVHAENHMVEGGPHKNYLHEICQDYALSIHGVGSSLGSAEGLSSKHLKRFRALVEEYKPWLVSEHLAWSVSGGHYLNDLLPLPLNEESLTVVADNIKRMQDAISRTILVENPSSYMAFNETTIPEPEFLEMLVQKTGCGLLVDINNIYVSCRNMGGDPEAFVDSLPSPAIAEIHMAGHLVKDIDGVELRIDDHGSEVCDDVWQLYERLISRIGARPTLLEWDTNIPTLSVLVSEAEKARSAMARALKTESETLYG